MSVRLRSRSRGPSGRSRSPVSPDADRVCGSALSSLVSLVTRVYHCAADYRSGSGSMYTRLRQSMSLRKCYFFQARYLTWIDTACASYAPHLTNWFNSLQHIVLRLSCGAPSALQATTTAAASHPYPTSALRKRPHGRRIRVAHNQRGTKAQRRGAVPFECVHVLFPSKPSTRRCVMP